VSNTSHSHDRVELDTLLGSDPPDGLLSVDHAAKALQLPADVVRRAIKHGALRAVDAPEPRVSAQSVDAFLTARLAVNRATVPPEAA